MIFFSCCGNYAIIISVKHKKLRGAMHMQTRLFEFRGSGFGYIWVILWTTVVTMVTLGLFFPWAYSAQQRWIASNTYLNGQPLRFDGTGIGFFGQWLLILVLSFITLGIYIPWGYCRFKRWEVENTFLQSAN